MHRRSARQTLAGAERKKEVWQAVRSAPRRANSSARPAPRGEADHGLCRNRNAKLNVTHGNDTLSDANRIGLN